MTLAVTGPADIRDQRWLDERVVSIGDGIDAVLDIAVNWAGGRTLSRLHPGVSAQEYILAHCAHPLGRGVVVPLLTETNLSNRQIAAVAGVSRNTVNQLAQEVPVDRPPETLGADGKLRALPTRPRLDPAPDPYFTRATEPVAAPTVIEPEAPTVSEPVPEWAVLVQVMESIDALSSSDAAYLAATVPDRRRATTAKRLRKLGTYLGRIAWALEGNEESHDTPSD